MWLPLKGQADSVGQGREKPSGLLSGEYGEGNGKLMEEAELNSGGSENQPS